MASDVIHLVRAVGEEEVGIRQRLAGLLAIVRIIETEELLAALPDCMFARNQHMVALSLLSIVERELESLSGETS